MGTSAKRVASTVIGVRLSMHTEQPKDTDLREKPMCGRALHLATVFALSVMSARAQDVEDFYKGRTMTLIVSSDVGGGYDAYARLLARHITRHVPGRPGIVVQNMPGASSLNAVNYIANVASHDGLVFSDAEHDAVLHAV